MLTPKKERERNFISFFLWNNKCYFLTLFNQNRMTIFLVDDDEDDRKLFIEAVMDFNNEITCMAADNGEKALLYLKDTVNQVPDFIFLDLRMPGISGRQCLEEIKKDARLQRVPVLSILLPGM